MPQTRAQIWGTLKRYLAYTAAGFVILGGVGAMEQARPPLMGAASASQNPSQTLRASVSPQALLATIASDVPSWTQRLHFELTSVKAVAAAKPAAAPSAMPTPYYPAPDTTWQTETAPADTPALQQAAPEPVKTPVATIIAAGLAESPAPAPAAKPADAKLATAKPAETTTQSKPAPQVVATAAIEPSKPVIAPEPAASASATKPAATTPAAAPSAAPTQAAAAKPAAAKPTSTGSTSLLATLNWVYGDSDAAPTAPDSAAVTSTDADTPDSSAATDMPAPDQVADATPTDVPTADAPTADASAADASSADAPTADASNSDAPADTVADTGNDTGDASGSGPATDAALASATQSDAQPDTAPIGASPDSVAAANGETETVVGASKVIEVRRGDTLFGLLTQAGLSDAEAQAAGHSLADVFSPNDLRVGQEITLNFAAGSDQTDANGNKLVGLTLTPSAERDVKLTRTSDGQFVSAAVDRPLTEHVALAAGDIDLSLFESAHDAGVPVSLIGDLIKAFSYDVDFQRDIHEGDSFEALYEHYDNENGEVAKAGRLLYASLTVGGKPMAIYYFERDGDGEYYTADGVAVRKSLLKTPIDGARITSGYGMRVNPILGYSMMHQGIDFGAPIGTPIFAAGNGVVEEEGWKNGYGNYMRLRHNGTYETAYAHISKFASGVKRGTRVKQGQIIAYVGATGRATGPHLHFEILINGKHVNPSTVKTVSADKLKGTDLKAFKAEVAKIDGEKRQLAARSEIADQSGNVQLDCTHPRGCAN